MWKIAICDDEVDVCSQLRLELKQTGERLGCQFSVMEFHSSEELLEALPNDVDILLLDIKMGELSGIEAARALRMNNRDICIIFITSMTQFAIEGYEVHAFGFIKKPLDCAQLEWYLSDAIQKLENKRNNEVIIRLGNELRRVAVNSIVFIEAFAHQINLYTASETIHPSMTLTELETLLSARSFFRCHKSYLINLRHVSDIGRDRITMTNGRMVFLSKHRKKDFLAAFACYARGAL